MCPRARRISSFRENVAMLPRATICSQSFHQRSSSRVHLTVKAFVPSWSHALKPMPHNLSRGLASARRSLVSVHEGQARFLVLGEFCQVASEDYMFALLLPEIVIEVAYMTPEAVLLSEIVNSKYCRERQVVAE